MKLNIFKREELTPEEQQRRLAVKDAERRLKEAEKAHQSSVKEAKRSVEQAEKEHANAVKQAHKDLEAAEKAHSKAVSASEKRLKKARESGTRRLGSQAGITLYEDRITAPEGTSPLSPEVNAAVDTAGNLAVTKRVTVTRLVGGGIVGGLLFQKKQKHDTRELYLLLETPTFATVAKGDPDRGAQLRSFAAQINTTARNAAAIADQRQTDIASAEQGLERARGDRAAIEAAQRDVARVESETAAVTTARETLVEVESATGEVNAVKRQLEQLEQGEISAPPE